MLEGEQVLGMSDLTQRGVLNFGAIIAVVAAALFLSIMFSYSAMLEH